MTLPEIVFACAIVFIGLPSAIQLRPLRLRNLTALALVLGWLVNQQAWRMTGGGDLTRLYLIVDMATVAAIYCKVEAHPQFPYRNRWHQLASFWLEPSYWDRAILGIFAVMWCVYASALTPYHKWAVLWWLALAQILCACGEAFKHVLARHSAKMPRRETTDISGLPRWGEAYG